MDSKIELRVLAPDANKKGDLFGRLMADLFIALGYETPRLNIHKSGREIDLTAVHRFEPKQAVAECKALAEPAGGAALNKFVGAMDAERAEGVDTIGYFISLSGFTQTAIAQEANRRTAIHLLDSEQIVRELIRGRIVVPVERATETAGRCCSAHDHLEIDSVFELLAHDLGWIWAIFYTKEKLRTSFVLVHSDGTLLAPELASMIINSDLHISGELKNLSCLNQYSSSKVLSLAQSEKVMEAYRTYLAEECGYIHLDGLPADSDVGSRRMKIENLFIPLYVDVDPDLFPLNYDDLYSISKSSHVSSLDSSSMLVSELGIIPPFNKNSEDNQVATHEAVIAEDDDDEEIVRESIGKVLQFTKRLAILAAPGGGKSTLLKRIAIAYSHQDRRSLVNDELPSREWLPLFFRCRELRGLARGSFAELIDGLAEREPIRIHKEHFRLLVDQALLNGRAILLIDGLDEISDPGDRASFVCTIRSALLAYPHTAVIISSREAGFRHVASHLAATCLVVKLSQFDRFDIERLSVAWHSEVVGKNDRVRSDAVELARTISGNDRIFRLACNPLLLTTLFLVRRWVGSLPTRRAVLYAKAVEVLLMTWNTEGHDPIRDDEALPQLCYIAHSMMSMEVERISRRKLAMLLLESRKMLPAELGYVKGSVDEFIHRIEDRSSLIMMTGHDIENGQLEEFFEFRHLTFQEFLTAKAVVNGWYANKKEEDKLVDVLRPMLMNPKWSEVVPLAAALSGKEAETLIKYLSDSLDQPRSQEEDDVESEYLFNALARCLADEATANPETVLKALHSLVRNCFGMLPSTLRPIYDGRYGDSLARVIEQWFLDTDENIGAMSILLQTAVEAKYLKLSTHFNPTSVAQDFLVMMNDEKLLQRCSGAVGIVALLNRGSRVRNEVLSHSVCEQLAEACSTLLYSSDNREQYLGGWILYILGRLDQWSVFIKPDLLSRVLTLSAKDPKSALVSTFLAQNFPDRAAMEDFLGVGAETAKEILSFLQLDIEKRDEIDVRQMTMALVYAWYTRSVDDVLLKEICRELLELDHYETRHVDHLLRIINAT